MAEYTAYENASVFTINNKSVAEEAFRSFSKEQDGKKDVVWHEFSEENMNTMLVSPNGN